MQNTQQIKTVVTRKLTEAELTNYFFPRPYSLWSGVSFLVGVVLFALGLFLQNIILLGGLIMIALSGLTIYRTRMSNPDDARYDAWVERQGQLLYKRGMQALGIRKSAITDPVLCIRSVILPGSRSADEYDADDVCMKYGKDGHERFSINVYTYLYPTAQSLAIFVSDINAFNPTHHNEHTEIYAYRHIVSATTSLTRDTVLLEEQKYPYRIEQLCLKITNGETVQLSAAVTAGPSGSAAGVPAIRIHEVDFKKTLSRLRQLLMDKM